MVTSVCFLATVGLWLLIVYFLNGFPGRNYLAIQKYFEDILLERVDQQKGFEGFIDDFYYSKESLENPQLVRESRGYLPKDLFFGNLVTSVEELNYEDMCQDRHVYSFSNFSEKVCGKNQNGGGESLYSLQENQLEEIINQNLRKLSFLQ